MTGRLSWTPPTPSAVHGSAARVMSSLHDHWLVLVLLMASAALRAALICTFHPAIWYLGDSVGYVEHSMLVHPDALRPLGYSLLLALLRPFHDLQAAVVTQHVLGLLTGILVYAVLRRFGLPKWGSALGAVPVLFEGLSLSIAHYLVAESLFTTLVMAALAAVVLAGPAHPLLAVACAGVLLALAAVTREVGLPLGPLLVVVLAVRCRWRSAAVAAVAFSVPLLLYAGWAQSSFGRYGITGSAGLFRYARAAPVASCRGLVLPPQERPLCAPVVGRQNANWYLFNGASPLNQLPRDIPRRSDIAGDFASRVLRRQPGDVARAALADLRHQLTLSVPGSYALPRYGEHLVGRAEQVGRRYQSGVPPQLRRPGPAAADLRVVQGALSMPAAAYPAALLCGLAGCLTELLRRRQHACVPGDLALLVLAGAALLTVPPLSAQIDARYLVPVLPLASLSAAAGMHALLRAALSGRRSSPV